MRDIEHIGPAHDDAELELLKAAARQRLATAPVSAGLALPVLRWLVLDLPGPVATGQLVDEVTVLGTGHQGSVGVAERPDPAHPALLQHPPRAGVISHRGRDDPVEVQALEC